MKYKALFLDVDGTTVIHGLHNLPSPRVTHAIRAAMKQGLSVSLATSRPPKSVLHIIDHLNLNGYCVLSSGAQMYDPATHRIVIEKQFPPDAIRHIAAAATEHHVTVRIYDGEREYDFDGSMVPQKVLGMYFPELEPAVLQEISKTLGPVEGISMHRMEAWDSRYECLDIVNNEASKLHGIVEVSRLTGIETHEIVGVGDGYNDFPLLLACGLKIAMGNAVPELKEIADFVAPPVEEDGVAVVIEKFILAG